MSTPPEFDLVPETPQDFGGVLYTARRNAQPEPDGTWRWQVFAETGALVGYVQSHRCFLTACALRLLVFNAAGKPMDEGCVKDYEHPCVCDYRNALHCLSLGHWPTPQ